MEGNTPTKVSSASKSVVNATVIRFIENPSYRDFDIDISCKLPLELLGIKNYRGELRAEVNSAINRPQTCHVIIANLEFEVEVGFCGLVSIGIEGA